MGAYGAASFPSWSMVQSRYRRVCHGIGLAIVVLRIVEQLLELPIVADQQHCSLRKRSLGRFPELPINDAFRRRKPDPYSRPSRSVPRSLLDHQHFQRHIQR